MPVLLVTTSTFYTQALDYFQMCIDALSGFGWHVVLAIGSNNDAADLLPLPPHFEIVQHIPQIQVLPSSALMICLGGMITTVEAMYHGVPLIMISHGQLEPEWYGESFARLGLGIHLRKQDTDIKTVRDAVLMISAEVAIQNAVRRMQYAVKRSPGAEETANRIEEYLQLAGNPQNLHGQRVDPPSTRSSACR